MSDWSSDGCEVISFTGNSVTCASDHLTIFGSLVQVSCMCVCVRMFYYCYIIQWNLSIKDTLGP